MTSMPISRTAQLLDDLDAAFAWMASLGVTVAPERRTGYLKMAEKWDEFAAGGGKLGAQALYPIAATFASEVTALIQVYRAFSVRPSAEQAKLLVQLGQAGGAPVRIDDARGAHANLARAALFRLQAAAHAIPAADGGQVLVDAAGDATFGQGRHHFHLHARRLGAEQGIDAGLAGACAALMRSFDARPRPRARGLIALDLSALIRPASPDLPAAMDGAADQLLMHFLDQHMAAIQAGLRPLDSRIVCVLVLYSGAGMADGAGGLLQVGRWALLWRDGISFGDATLLDRVRTLLRGAG